MSLTESVFPTVSLARPRVLVVSDVRLYRDGLVWGLAASGRLEVVGTAEAAPLALHRVIEVRPDIALVDMGMASAPEFVRASAVAAPHTRVVAFAVGDDDQLILACIEAGISGYVPRDASIDDLIATVESVLRGEPRCAPRVVASLFRRLADLAGDRPIGAPDQPLTRREQEIVDLLRDGLSNKEIAVRLGIELATTKNHVHHILEKLKVRRRSQIAGRTGWRRV